MFIAPSSDYYEGRYPHSFIIDIERPENYYNIKVLRVSLEDGTYSHAISIYKERQQFAILSADGKGIEIHDFQKKQCVKVIGEFKEAINMAYIKSQDRFIVFFPKYFEVWDAQNNKKITCRWLPKSA
jgi:hypothetical protein